MIELLTNNHLDKILDLFDSVENKVNIISPFLTMSMAEKLCDVKGKKNLTCTFITRIYLEDLLAKANSLDALELMVDKGITVYAVKRLHTKLYLFDDANAVMGSANFTTSGLKRNIELSLLLSKEPSVSDKLQDYFEEMVAAIKQSGDGTVTKAMLEEIRKRYTLAFDSRKRAQPSDKANYNRIMYGAILNDMDRRKLKDNPDAELAECANETDPIYDLFKPLDRAEQIKYPFTIWLKFDGNGNDRIAGDGAFPMTSVEINCKTAYLSNYPFKVHSVKDGDEVYLAAISTDSHGKNQPLIVGRGHLAGFIEENRVTEAMVQKYSWMTRYPWYCVITDCEVLDTAVSNGVPMDSVWDKLGADTYIASFGRNEDIAAVARKHHKKAHIRLSGNAKDYIDKELDVLKNKYGTVKYRSE